jgi:hypothetical protein
MSTKKKVSLASKLNPKSKSKKATVKNKKEEGTPESYTKDNSGLLIDRHGEDCGYVLYSPYFDDDIILVLNEEAPRNITLDTWQRWGKQAMAYRHSLEALLKPAKKEQKKTKAKKKVSKTVKKKKGK